MTTKNPSGFVPALKSQPWLVSAIFGAALLSLVFRGQRTLGFALQGWLWALILAASLLVLAQRLDKVTFPWKLWAPWMLWIVVYAFSGYPRAFQATAQILCPVFAGIAVSTMAVRPETLDLIVGFMRAAFKGFLAIFLVFVLPWTLRDIDNSGFPAGAIHALFYQAFFLCAFLLGHDRRRNLLMYLAALAVPAISANRGPMLASFGLVLATVAPLPLKKRLIIVVSGLAGGVALFYTPKVQHKMFFSGKGDLWDLRMDNPDFNTSGRKLTWDLMEAGIREKPWLGHGAKAESILLTSRGFADQPHNDWLRIRYNYGNLGAALFAATLLVQMWMLYRRSKTASPVGRLMFCCAATGFVPFMIIMNTDNALIYCQYFPVPLFVLMGMAYAAAGQERSAWNGATKRRLWLRRVPNQSVHVPEGAQRARARQVVVRATAFGISTNCS